MPPPSIEEMQFLAEHDPLTRLLNRRAFDAQLDAEMARAVRYEHPLALLLCDLNGFKQLNDDHGHAAGDIALERVGAALQATVRTVDSAFRIGGDEFAVLLPQTDRAEALAVIDRISAALQHDLEIGSVTATFGLAVHPEDGGDPHRLVRTADARHVRGQTRSRIGSHGNPTAVEGSRSGGLRSHRRAARDPRDCARVRRPPGDAGGTGKRHQSSPRYGHHRGHGRAGPSGSADPDRVRRRRARLRVRGADL